ncbi:type IV pilus biogenesis protein PilP [Pseudomonas chlororaphis]|uniref:type IV pilus biogenesis protein PilP n=1 Tax=Pseudomonas chlororaphis TaxID=587753 RepID=UPI002D791A29|nr:type IV pilus biogenesis protein PilP [Pseudomonas chlororaphis]
MHVKSLLLVTLALPVFAASASESSLPTVGELSKVQSETIMFQAKAARAAAEAAMLKNVLDAGGDPQAVQTQGAASVVASDLPTITGISGAAGRLYATFRYMNGTTVSSKSGEQIPGGFHVAEVALDRVVITKGDRRIPLQFGVAIEPAQAQQPQTPGVMPVFNTPSPQPMR